MIDQYIARYPELSEAQARIMYWRDYPPQFVRDIFGAEPDKWQQEALQALADHDKVSIRSGHGVGKSTLDSWAILWFLSCHFTRNRCNFKIIQPANKSAF